MNIFDIESLGRLVYDELAARRDDKNGWKEQ